MTSAIVLGSNGFLGSRIVKAGEGRLSPEVVNQVLTSRDLDTFAGKVERIVKLREASAIINCLGRRHGTEEVLNLANHQIPVALMQVARSLGVQLIHLASASEVAAFTSDRVSMSDYSRSKLAGTQACLEYEKSKVLRIYNMHGLPHQESSGLHQLCHAIAESQRNSRVVEIIDTVRDYVSVDHVVSEIIRSLDDTSAGLREVCSGQPIRLSEILAQLQQSRLDRYEVVFAPATEVGPVIGPSKYTKIGASDKRTLLLRIAREVQTCAESLTQE